MFRSVQNSEFLSLYSLLSTLILAILLSSFTARADSPIEKTVSQTQYQVFERANQLYRDGKFAKAVLLYKKAGKRSADPEAVAFNLGNCYYRLDKLSKAAASFRRAVRESGGRNTSALFNLAGVLFRLEHYGECIAVYRRALKAAPDNTSAWLYLSDAYLRTGDLIGAQMALEKAYNQDPEDVSILYQLAEIHVALKEYDPAIHMIRRAYSKKPSEVDFLFYIGDLYRAQGKYESAASVFREGLALQPQDYNVLYKLADVLYQDGKPFLAMEYLQRALAIKRNFSDAAVFLGNLAFDQRWWIRAEKAYFSALKAGNREGLEGLRNLAYEYQEMDQVKKAVSVLERARNLVPKDSQLNEEIEKYRKQL
jgi:tetratricopeptide (TPR) repeat protein